jgi:hypothetical protein
MIGDIRFSRLISIIIGRTVMPANGHVFLVFFVTV